MDALDVGAGATGWLAPLATFSFIGLVVVNRMIAGTVQIMNTLLGFRPAQALPVVQEIWKIVRDFANMLFILALLLMALGTVFNVKLLGWSGYEISNEFMVRFLIAALLINFSLTICGAILDASQVISNPLLASIGNFGDRLGSTLNPMVLIGLEPSQVPIVGTYIDTALAGKTLASATFSTLFRLVFTLILSVMFFFSLLVPAFVLLIRVLYLPVLAVASPMVWVAGLFPNGKKWGEEWWKQYLGWSFFLPPYLLVLYFVFFLLSRQNTVLASVANGIDTNSVFSTALGLPAIAFQSIFFYFFAALALTAGTAGVLNLSFIAGTAAGSYAKSARDRVGSWWFGGRQAVGAAAGGVAGAVRGTRETGTFSGTLKGLATGTAGGLFGSKQVTEAIEKRRKEYLEEVKKEGLPGRFGGTRKGERLGAQVAGLLGDKGAVAARLRTDVADFRKEYDEAGLTPEQLREVIADRGESAEHKLAAYELLKAKKVITASEINHAFNLYKTNNAIRSATAFALDIEYDKLSRSERKELFDSIPSADIRRKLARAMAQEGELETSEDLESVLGLFEPESVKIDFLKTAAKKKLVEAYQVASDLKLIKGPDKKTPLTFSDALKAENARRRGDDKLDLITRDLFYTAASDKTPLPTDKEELAKEEARREKKEDGYTELRKLIEAELKDPKSGNQLHRNMVRNFKATPDQLKIIDALKTGTSYVP